MPYAKDTAAGIKHFVLSEVSQRMGIKPAKVVNEVSNTAS